MSKKDFGHAFGQSEIRNYSIQKTAIFLIEDFRKARLSRDPELFDPPTRHSHDWSPVERLSFIFIKAQQLLQQTPH